MPQISKFLVYIRIDKRPGPGEHRDSWPASHCGSAWILFMLHWLTYEGHGRWDLMIRLGFLSSESVARSPSRPWLGPPGTPGHKSRQGRPQVWLKLAAACRRTSAAKWEAHISAYSAYLDCIFCILLHIFYIPSSTRSISKVGSAYSCIFCILKSWLHILHIPAYFVHISCIFS
jgi:hypothetical protein